MGCPWLPIAPTSKIKHDRHSKNQVDRESPRFPKTGARQPPAVAKKTRHPSRPAFRSGDSRSNTRTCSFTRLLRSLWHQHPNVPQNDSLSLPGVEINQPTFSTSIAAENTSSPSLEKLAIQQLQPTPTSSSHETPSSTSSTSPSTTFRNSVANNVSSNLPHDRQLPRQPERILVHPEKSLGSLEVITGAPTTSAALRRKNSSRSTQGNHSRFIRPRQPARPSTASSVASVSSSLAADWEPPSPKPLEDDVDASTHFLKLSPPPLSPRKHVREALCVSKTIPLGHPPKSGGCQATVS